MIDQGQSWPFATKTGYIKKKKKNATWHCQSAHSVTALVLCPCPAVYFTNSYKPWFKWMVQTPRLNVLYVSSPKFPSVALTWLEFKQKKSHFDSTKFFLECSLHFLLVHLIVLYNVGKFHSPSSILFEIWIIIQYFWSSLDRQTDRNNAYEPTFWPAVIPMKTEVWSDMLF